MAVSTETVFLGCMMYIHIDFGWSCVEPGVGLTDPCVTLPTRDIPILCTQSSAGAAPHTFHRQENRGSPCWASGLGCTTGRCPQARGYSRRTPGAFHVWDGELGARRGLAAAVPGREGARPGRAGPGEAGALPGGGGRSRPAPPLPGGTRRARARRRRRRLGHLRLQPAASLPGPPRPVPRSTAQGRPGAR